MNNSCLQGIFLVGTILFATPAFRAALALIHLLSALISGAVQWPGPYVHDPDPRVVRGRQGLGLKPENLFPTFVQNALGLIGAFTFFILSFLSETSFFSNYIQIRWTWVGIFFAFFAFIAGAINARRAGYHMNQVNILLADLRSGAEPRHVDGISAESEYAIEHPLLSHESQTPGFSNALQLFSEGTVYLQDGKQQQALVLYQQSMQIDPSLHTHAREALSGLISENDPKEAGAIYYWLGAHSEYLADFAQAKTWYEKAIAAFKQLGYTKRESRVHCNLGNVKMRTLDASAMDEFEKAIELNPRNGIAHINIGTAYYRISERGDPRFDRALDAYADAVIADPIRYGPLVISRLREIGYTWKEDLEDITQRVEKKRRGFNSGKPS